MCSLIISMSSQFNNYLPRSRPINKYGEEAYRESNRFGKHKKKMVLKQKNNIMYFHSLVSVMFIQFITYHYVFVNLVDLYLKVHLFLGI